MGERMRVAEARAQERDANLAQQLELLRATVEKLHVDSDAEKARPWQASSSAEASSDCQQQRVPVEATEQVALLQSAAPQLRGDTLGAKAGWRSRHISGATPTEITAPRFHRLLIAKFASFSKAAACTKAWQGGCFDRGGGAVEVIHKGAKQQRRPQVNRRGQALAPVRQEVKAVLGPGEACVARHQVLRSE